MPPNCMNLENAKVMENMVGRFLGTDLSSLPSRIWKKFLQIKVAINVNQRLTCGFFHETIEQEKILIPLRYERLSEFCYKCGHLNHVEKDCTSEEKHCLPLDPQVAFVPWMRAAIINWIK